jgi:hypothetical protein
MRPTARQGRHQCAPAQQQRQGQRERQPQQPGQEQRKRPGRLVSFAAEVRGNLAARLPRPGAQQGERKAPGYAASRRKYSLEEGSGGLTYFHQARFSSARAWRVLGVSSVPSSAAM